MTLTPSATLSVPTTNLSIVEPRPAHIISNSMTIAIDAPANATRRALNRLDLARPALRALQELGLDHRVTLRPGGLTWHQHGTSGTIDVDVDLRVEAADDDSSRLSIGTSFSAVDERARVQLLDAWALVGPVSSNLVDRAARSVKEYAERDAFDDEEVVEARLRAA